LQLYGIESYVAVPLTRRDGSYFGTLCTLDPQPKELDDQHFEVFTLLAQLIAFELEAEEEQRKQELKRRALEDVIAVAAHDLRTPLTVLYGKLQMLARRIRRGTPASELVEATEGLLAQTRRTVQLSDTLLDLARIEVGALNMDHDQFDLVATARQTLEDVQTVALEHTFVFEAPSTLPIRGDERRLGQVLRNLLENAVKYASADKGPVILTIKTTSSVNGQAQVILSVRDSGTGVSDGELPRLFNRLYRTPSAVAQGIRGSGLGLYIVRQIVEAHNGRIWAEHAPGGGLLVNIVLPYA
jgi:signal transduction histidine kinase